MKNSIGVEQAPVPEPKLDAAFEFRVADLRRLYRATRVPFLILAAVALLLSFLYLRLVEPSFSILSEIVVERKQLTAAQDEGGESVRFNATQAEILKSSRIVGAALQRHPLPPIQRDAARDANSSEVRWVLENLIVSPITGTQVIAIAYNTSDPQHGVAFLDSMVAQYLLLSRGTDMAQQEETLELLRTSETQLRRKLVELEVHYREVRVQNDSLGEGDEALSLYKQVAVDYNEQRLRAEKEVAGLVARLATLRRAKTTDEIMALGPNYVQGSTGRAVAQAKVDIARLLASYRKDHPDLVAARHNLGDLEGRLRTEADKQASIISNQLSDARRETARLESAYQAAVANAKSIDVQRLSQDSIRAEIESTKTLLQEASGRINDRSLAIGSLAGGRAGTVAAVIRAPEVPLEATWPRPRMVYALALLLAAALAGLYGLLKIARENRLSYGLFQERVGPTASELMREAARRRVAA